MHKLAQSVLGHIRKHDLLRAGERVGVAVSGGADSVALLRVLLELRADLGVVLSVVHLNHKLRGAESDADEAFIRQLAAKHGLECRSEAADVNACAAEKKLSMEAAARELRYRFFELLLHSREVNKVVTAHTLDDQAETVLLRLLRGTGFRGLGSIRPKLQIEDAAGEVCGEIVRPLLATRRAEALEYLNDVEQQWREDESNQRPEFTRNRVRHTLIPLLEREFNSAIAEKLAELAEIAQGEEEFWDGECNRLLSEIVNVSTPEWANFYYTPIPNAAPPVHSDPAVLEKTKEPGPWIANLVLDISRLNKLAVGVQRRLIHSLASFGMPLEFKHVQQVLELARSDEAAKEIQLPWGWKAVRDKNQLRFLTPDLRTEERIPSTYEYTLHVPGTVVAWEAGIGIEAVMVGDQDHDREQLLDGSYAKKALVVRNWRAGDRFWPSHTKTPKKVKELLQDRHITGPEKKRWPVVASGEDVVWLRGFGVRRDFQAKGMEGILIREVSE